MNSFLGDAEILTYIRQNGSIVAPVTLQEIADHFGDIRGFSKRLPRMVRDGLINGDNKLGYWP